jgi:hypothetical protein
LCQPQRQGRSNGQDSQRNQFEHGCFHGDDLMRECLSVDFFPARIFDKSGNNINAIFNDIFRRFCLTHLPASQQSCRA